jgi:hypothetical protein
VVRGYCYKHNLGISLLLCIFGRHNWEREGYYATRPNSEKVLCWVDKCSRCRAACDVIESPRDPVKPRPDWSRSGTQPTGDVGPPPRPNGRRVATRPTDKGG